MSIVRTKNARVNKPIFQKSKCNNTLPKVITLEEKLKIKKTFITGNNANLSRLIWKRNETKRTKMHEKVTRSTR